MDLSGGSRDEGSTTLAGTPQLLLAGISGTKPRSRVFYPDSGSLATRLSVHEFGCSKVRKCPTA